MKSLWLLLIYLLLPISHQAVSQDTAHAKDPGAQPIFFQITGTPTSTVGADQPTPTYIPLPSVTFVFPEQELETPSSLLSSERNRQPVAGPVKEPAHSLVGSPWTIGALVILGAFWVVLLVLFMTWRKNRL